MARSRQTRRKLLQSAAAASAASSLAKFGVTPSWSATAAKRHHLAAFDADSAALDAVDVAQIAANEHGVFYEKSWGKHSVFWIASMTKPITAVAAMQLVEQGKLKLDEPIKRVLPALANPQVLEGFDNNGKPKLRPAKGDITLRHLLTHTSGFTYDIWNADTAKYVKYANLPPITSGKNAALKTPLAFDPGTRWEYGISLDWVGKAVEAVSGQNLRDYLRQHVFQPLKMNNTDFILSPDMRAQRATMFARQQDSFGGLAQMQFELPQQPEFFAGGSALYGTARDYIVFLQMLMHRGTFNGARILGQETVAQMFSNNIGDINISRVVLKTTAPNLSPDLDMGKLIPGQDVKWGLSFLINPQDVVAARSGGSLSWAGLANTYFWLDPVKRVAGIYLIQILPFLDLRILQYFPVFENLVYSLNRN